MQDPADRKDLLPAGIPGNAASLTRPISIWKRIRPAGLFQTGNSPSIFFEFLEVYSGIPIYRRRPLVILDGLQACPAARDALGRFAAEFPGYSIAAAEQVSDAQTLPPLAPADAQVESLHVLDFEEFLWACREVSLAREIREHFLSQTPMERKLHQQALRLFRLYLVTGGFPGAVERYRQEHSLLGIPDIHSKVRQLDLEDISAGTGKEERNATRACYFSLPQQLRKANPCFQYRAARRGSTRAGMGQGIQWVCAHQLALRQPEAPAGYSGEGTAPARFRLYFRDVGLCATAMGVPASSLLRLERTLAVQRVVENTLAVTFAGNGYRLSYWSSGNKAVLAFLLEKGEEWIAIDMHFEEDKKSRSLFEFQKQAGRAEWTYRISEENFKRTERYSQIPYYAAFCI